MKRFGIFLLPVLGGLFQWFAFAGFQIWPLAFVCFLPTMWAIDKHTSSWKGAALFGFLHGFVGYAGGYYWLIPFMQTFSGFNIAACIGFGSIFFAYSGLHQMLILIIYRALRTRGYSHFLSFLPAFALVEHFFPYLFPAYMATGFHNQVEFIQSADIGGPVLVSIIAASPNGALADFLFQKGNRKNAIQLAVVAALLLLNFGYGTYQISQVEEASEAAKKIRVGMVQVNMGIFEKRQNARLGLLRHIEQSKRLESKGVDLLVWPESAATFYLPGDIKNVRRQVMGDLKTPLLFGGLALDRGDEKFKHYNRAFFADEKGDVLGTYDKTFLLAFGEYLPFGDMFPILYEWSPNTGHFTKGNHQKPFIWNDIRLTTLICYEDLLPDFTRAAVKEGRPDLLVNITNDAWFSHSEEPEVHLALAKFRSVEHHRAMVRSTNSGVSAFIDPKGRIISRIDNLERGQIIESLPLLSEDTLYLTLGDWPGYVGLGCVLLLFLLHRRRKSSARTAASES